METKRYAYLLAGLLCILPGLSQAAKQTYTFGIVPQQSASKLSKLWTPFLKYLSDKSGDRMRFSTSRSIGSYSDNLYDGKYDFSYGNPYHYLRAHNSAGYEAFAKAKDRRLKGILVVKADSPITELADLEGQTIAFPSPNAFAASMVIRAQFRRLGINIEPKYVNSHDAGYRNVAKGRFPAAGGVMRTFRNMPDEVRNDLKVLWTSDGYTPHAFMAHPRVPADVVRNLQQIMIEMADDEKGKIWLKRIELSAIEAAQDKDWDDIRALNIEALEN